MKKTTLLFTFTLFLSFFVSAQQDAMFTKYMFNSLAYNPAYAGSSDFLTVRALYRNQWWGIDGAPTTQTATVHSPIWEKVGLGFSIVNDKIGATGSTNANFSYAYKIPFGKGKLSLGLQAGVMNWRANWDVLKYKDPRALDVAFMDETPNRWMPNFGAGAYYSTKKYYVGISVPHLINYELRHPDPSEGKIRSAQLARHYYLAAGMVFPLGSPALIFKPSFLIKSVGLLGGFKAETGTIKQVGAPTEFDIDLSLMFYEALWIGVSFRSAIEAKAFGGKSSFDSADIWASYYLKNGFRIGLSYDYTLTALQKFADGSFEIMLGYDFNYSTDKVNTPRYF